MDTIIELLLVFVMPAIAAAIAIGSIGKKIAFYVGGAAAVFSSEIVTIAVFSALAQIARSKGEVQLSDPGTEEVVSIFVMFAVAMLVIGVAGSSGKKCTACLSRIHPKATRCPKCRADLSSTIVMTNLVLPPGTHPFGASSANDKRVSNLAISSFVAAGIVAISVLVYSAMSSGTPIPKEKTMTAEEIREVDCRATRAAYANMPALSRESQKQLDICNGKTPAPAPVDPAYKSLEQLQRETTELLKKK